MNIDYPDGILKTIKFVKEGYCEAIFKVGDHYLTDHYINSSIFQYIIFNNGIISNVSNDGWAGFFGGYIGSIIGAFATIKEIVMESAFQPKWKFQKNLKNHSFVLLYV